jgi:hypothetical protein
VTNSSSNAAGKPNGMTDIRKICKLMSNDKKLDKLRGIWEPDIINNFPTATSNETFSLKDDFNITGSCNTSGTYIKNRKIQSIPSIVSVIAPLEVGKSGGQAAKKLVVCGFSKLKMATECIDNHQKNNYHVNLVCTYEYLLDKQSGKFISFDKQLDKKIPHA